ncbi:MAG: hypothetical protein RLO52_15535 [Sandaracinaceae bacterium]
MRHSPRPSLLRIALASAAALGLAACGAAPPKTTPAVEAEPVAAVGEPGCGVDVSPTHDRQIVAVLEESGDLTAAARRYEIDTYGVLETSGFASIESVIPPEGQDGTQLASDLRVELEETGLFALPEGCYADDLDSVDARVVSLAVPHEGRILQYATREGEGPLPLLRAALVIRRYVETIAATDVEEARQAAHLPAGGETVVTVVRDR